MIDICTCELNVCNQHFVSFIELTISNYFDITWILAECSNDKSVRIEHSVWIICSHPLSSHTGGLSYSITTQRSKHVESIVHNILFSLQSRIPHTQTNQKTSEPAAHLMYQYPLAVNDHNRSDIHTHFLCKFLWELCSYTHSTSNERSNSNGSIDVQTIQRAWSIRRVGCWQSRFTLSFQFNIIVMFCHVMVYQPRALVSFVWLDSICDRTDESRVCKIVLLRDLFERFPDTPMNIDVKVNDDQLIQKVLRSLLPAGNIFLFLPIKCDNIDDSSLVWKNPRL